LGEFGPDPRSGDGKQYACKHCYVDYQTNSGQLGAYRARKLGAQVAGPVPPGTYAAIRASGPCVYCDATATTVDHVTPLARGGHEAEYNLVPACGSCNSSKGAKLLPEWDTARVAHAVLCSERVAAQLDLQLAA
jgi:5-methylcytosine-specific restriction endonuclease McrA